MKQTILLVSDDQESAHIWASGLRHRGIEVILRSSNVSSVDEAAGSTSDVDLVIIDTYERNMDGIDYVRRIRTNTDKPILLFTYESDERYHVDAYRSGVEECVEKPIGIPLSLSKVQAWLRRANAGCKDTRNSARLEFHLDDARRQLTLPDGASMRLSNLEYRLMRLFFSNEGQILETDLIIERVWVDYDEGDHTLLKNLIYRLRQKVEPNPASPRYIQTVPGVGYVFNAD